MFANARLEVPTRSREGLLLNIFVPKTYDRLAIIANGKGRKMIVQRESVDGKKAREERMGQTYNPNLWGSATVGAIDVPQNLEDKGVIAKLRGAIEDLIIKTLSERPLGEK